MKAVCLLDNSEIEIHEPTYRHRMWGAEYDGDFSDDVTVCLIPTDNIDVKEVRHEYKFMYYRVGGKFYKAMFTKGSKQ